MSSDLLLPDSKPEEEYLLPDNVLVPIELAAAEEDRPYRDGELGDEYDEATDEEYIFVVFECDWIYSAIFIIYFFFFKLNKYDL